MLFLSDLLDEHGIRLNVLGKKELLPESVQISIRKAENMTSKNDRCVFYPRVASVSVLTLLSRVRSILNICIAYTSRDEITTAVEACVRTAIEAGHHAKLYVRVFIIHDALS